MNRVVIVLTVGQTDKRSLVTDHHVISEKTSTTTTTTTMTTTMKKTAGSRLPLLLFLSWFVWNGLSLSVFMSTVVSASSVSEPNECDDTAGEGYCQSDQEKDSAPNPGNFRRAHRSLDPSPIVSYPEGMHYDVYNCPSIPPEGYPLQWSASAVLKNWNPNVTDMPTKIHQGLCIFDDSTELEKANNYLMSDVPFVMRNAPDFVAAAQRWDRPGYLDGILSDPVYPVHKSANYTFQYWKRITNPPRGWTEPTEVLRIPYNEYKKLVYNASPEQPHYYMYAEGYSSPESQWKMFEELPRFQPDNFDLYHELPHTNQQKLHCKFGMEGNMAGTFIAGGRRNLSSFSFIDSGREVVELSCWCRAIVSTTTMTMTMMMMTASKKLYNEWLHGWHYSTLMHSLTHIDTHTHKTYVHTPT